MVGRCELGSTAASSTLQCICSLVFGSDGSGLTSLQIWTLLQNYIPFCLIPTLLTLDMIARLQALLSTEATEKAHAKDE